MVRGGTLLQNKPEALPQVFCVLNVMLVRGERIGYVFKGENL